MEQRFQEAKQVRYSTYVCTKHEIITPMIGMEMCFHLTSSLQKDTLNLYMVLIPPLPSPPPHPQFFYHLDCMSSIFLLQISTQASAAKAELEIKFPAAFSDHNGTKRQSRAFVEECKHSTEQPESSQKELTAVCMKPTKKMDLVQNQPHTSVQQEKAVDAACKWSPSMQRKRPTAAPSPRQHSQLPSQQKQNVQSSAFQEALADHRVQQTTSPLSSQMSGSSVTSHPSTGYHSNTGFTANWSSTHTSQIRPQQLPIAAQKRVPSSSSTQRIVPGSTSTQPIVPGFTPAHQNAQAVSGTQSCTIACSPSSGTTDIGQDTCSIIAGKSPALLYGLPTPSQQWLPSNIRPSSQQYGTSSAYIRSSQDVSPYMVGTRQVSQSPQLAPTTMTPSPLSPLLPIALTHVTCIRNSISAMEQSLDVISTTNNVVENSTLQGLGSAINRTLGHGSEDSETVTRPQALKEQRRDISSDELARQISHTYNQIDLHLIEGLHSIH